MPASVVSAPPLPLLPPVPFPVWPQYSHRLSHHPCYHFLATEKVQSEQGHAAESASCLRAERPHREDLSPAAPLGISAGLAFWQMASFRNRLWHLLLFLECIWSPGPQKPSENLKFFICSFKLPFLLQGCVECLHCAGLCAPC